MKEENRGGEEEEKDRRCQIKESIWKWGGALNLSASKSMLAAKACFARILGFDLDPAKTFRTGNRGCTCDD